MMFIYALFDVYLRPLHWIMISGHNFDFLELKLLLVVKHSLTYLISIMDG